MAFLLSVDPLLQVQMHTHSHTSPHTHPCGWPMGSWPGTFWSCWITWALCHGPSISISTFQCVQPHKALILQASAQETDVRGPWDPAKPSAGGLSTSFDQEVLVEVLQKILLLLFILCKVTWPTLFWRGILKPVQNVFSCSSAGLRAAKAGTAGQF